MSEHSRQDRLITEANMTEFFRGAVREAMSNQHMEAEEETVYYVVSLLSCYARAEELYELTPDGLQLRPLALFYSDAVHASTAGQRNQYLRKLGDVALFIAGLFAHSLARKVVDVDYYVSMGSGAYGHLSTVPAGCARARIYNRIFEELSAKFQEFVDVLGEIGEQSGWRSDTDLLRLYDVWMKTGSRRAARQLQKFGIQPTAGSTSTTRH